MSDATMNPTIRALFLAAGLLFTLLASSAFVSSIGFGITHGEARAAPHPQATERLFLASLMALAITLLLLAAAALFLTAGCNGFTAARPRALFLMLFVSVSAAAYVLAVAALHGYMLDFTILVYQGLNRAIDAIAAYL